MDINKGSHFFVSFVYAFNLQVDRRSLWEDRIAFSRLITRGLP